VCSIAGEKTWPELGFRACERAWVREERQRWLRSPRVSGGGGHHFIGTQERRCGSWRWRPAGARQRAASRIERWTMTRWVPPVRPTETVSWLGTWWAGLAGSVDGFRPGELFPLFFSSFNYLSFSSIFYFRILIWIPICFAGFWIWNLNWGKPMTISIFL
jgi:hypothetical protein